MSYLINRISDWLAVNKLSLNVDKTKFMIFHNHQKVIPTHDIPCLVINNTVVEKVTEFNFFGLTINEFMNRSSHSSKIANKISRTLGILNRLKRYLPTSAMKLMYDSLVLSHLQFGITCWGFEWERIFKLQKRVLRIMTNSKYNAHTDPIFKGLEILKVKIYLMCNVWSCGINSLITNCPTSSSPCLLLTMNYMKRKPAAMVCSICIPRVLLEPVML